MQIPHRAQGFLASTALLSALYGLLGGGCCSPSKTFVQASRATYESIGKDFSSYVKADPALDADQKRIRLETLERWQEAIDAAEKDLADSK